MNLRRQSWRGRERQVRELEAEIASVVMAIQESEVGLNSIAVFVGMKFHPGCRVVPIVVGQASRRKTDLIRRYHRAKGKQEHRRANDRRVDSEYHCG